jgi:hypothetical protein
MHTGKNKTENSSPSGQSSILTKQATCKQEMPSWDNPEKSNGEWKRVAQNFRER